MTRWTSVDVETLSRRLDRLEGELLSADGGLVHQARFSQREDRDALAVFRIGGHPGLQGDGGDLAAKAKLPDWKRSNAALVSKKISSVYFWPPRARPMLACVRVA